MMSRAFLNRDLEGEIHRKCPKRFMYNDGETLLLKKSFYSLVQTARQFNKMWSKILLEIGFHKNKAKLFVPKAQEVVGQLICG